MFNRIVEELKQHAPFTALGAISGIVLMVFFKKIPSQTSYVIFYTLHPLHVLLSALATTSMYESHKCPANRRKCNIASLLFIGCVGSIGVATLSDSLIPYWGETLLDMPNRHIHIGFIEEWWIVIPLVIIGIAIAYFKPTTKFPHYGHVFLSTFASLFHMIMARGNHVDLVSYVVMFVFLFVAVWLPCCISDIVFPLLFIGKKQNT